MCNGRSWLGLLEYLIFKAIFLEIGLLLECIAEWSTPILDLLDIAEVKKPDTMLLLLF